ncbi:hypothetical protein TrRE_jg5556 [Triparma retinervis]|uniref:PDZ domain-containing protein n=1 Tax=Triparma retinervis TaxID=2557542 RepID=A0A9W6ZK67_9STRA|nr:hypothetical protein TrRE_jg5556 [Triparma retinervis]
MVFAFVKTIVSSALSLFPRRRKSSSPPSIIVPIDAANLNSKIDSDALTSLPVGFLHWNFSLTSQSSYTFHTFTFSKPSLGITINVRRPYSAIVSAIRPGGKHSGLMVGDVIVSIGGECPRQWLDMVAQQLLEAERPLEVKVMRIRGENDVITKALNESTPTVYTKAPRILSPRTEFAITQASSFSHPSSTPSSASSPGKSKKSAKSTKKGKGKTPARKGNKSAKSRQPAKVNDGTPSRKLKKNKSKGKKR